MTSAFTGRRVLVSAGPTYEDIDPVRFIGNRSSGKMGFAIAAAAAALGAEVLLIAGPVHLATPANLARVDVRSAAQMHAAVLAALPADVYIGAAAVADFTPAQVAPEKLRKVPGQTELTLSLVRTRDILAEVATHPRRPRLVVGFAAETDADAVALAARARGKLERKRVDVVAANRVGVAGSGFEADSNALQLFWHGGDLTLGPASKAQLAQDLLAFLGSRFPPPPP